jgi:Lar family restriction alleviation protein
MTSESFYLKPCPFCGGEALWYDAVGTKLKPAISCRKCNADMPCAGLDQAVAAWNTRPSQAPQDVAGLVEGDLEWLEGETMLNVGVKRSRMFHDARDMAEHNARIDRILSALRPSPISHEDRPLELAAADNNHKAHSPVSGGAG